MIKPSNFSLFTILISLLLASVFSTPIKGDLEIDVQVHKKKLLIGEPLLVKTTIQNTGNEKISIPWLGGKYYHNDNTLGMIIINENSYYPRMAPSIESQDSYLPTTLEPGDSYNERFLLLFDWKSEELIFKSDMKYKLKLRYGSYYSNAIKINIINSKKIINKEVWNSHLNKKLFEYVRLIHVPWQLNSRLSLREEELKIFDDLIARYKSSRYTPYLTFSLARYYRTLSVSDVNKNREYLMKAEKLLKKTDELTNNEIFEQFIQYEMEQIRSDKDTHDNLWIGKPVSQRVTLLKKMVSEADLSTKIKEKLLKKIAGIAEMLKSKHDKFSSNAERIKKVKKRLVGFINRVNELRGKQISHDIGLKIKYTALKIKKTLPLYLK